MNTAVMYRILFSIVTIQSTTIYINQATLHTKPQETICQTLESMVYLFTCAIRINQTQANRPTHTERVWVCQNHLKTFFLFLKVVAFRKRKAHVNANRPKAAESWLEAPNDDVNCGCQVVLSIPGC